MREAESPGQERGGGQPPPQAAPPATTGSWGARVTLTARGAELLGATWEKGFATSGRQACLQQKTKTTTPKEKKKMLSLDFGKHDNFWSSKYII